MLPYFRSGDKMLQIMFVMVFKVTKIPVFGCLLALFQVNTGNIMFQDCFS